MYSNMQEECIFNQSFFFTENLTFRDRNPKIIQPIKTSSVIEKHDNFLGGDLIGSSHVFLAVLVSHCTATRALVLPLASKSGSNLYLSGRTDHRKHGN
jgi:hypothetical protein